MEKLKNNLDIIIPVSLELDWVTYESVIECKMLDQNGKWNDVEFTRTEDGIKIKNKLEHITPMYILGK